MKIGLILFAKGSMYKYFDEDDFRGATPSCSINDMHKNFLWMLDKARDIAGIPFIISSAYRTLDWEKAHGRGGTSSHCKGIAVDIRCTDSVSRLKIVMALLEVGFRRIGIGKTFVHVDMDSSKVECMFDYY